ncbi:MAG: hypothetical protein JJ876_06605 [Muricauda sp.]|nr:hypothetical protein [Allomuricauda sp.]
MDKVVSSIHFLTAAKTAIFPIRQIKRGIRQLKRGIRQLASKTIKSFAYLVA